MMNDVGDAFATFDSDLRDKNELSKKENQTGDFEMKPLKIHPKQPKCNLLSNAQRSLVFLEHQSLISFVEADGEYIVSAGRDHEINVWDAVEGRHVRRLSGHNGPVTGLYLYNSGQPPFERVIVSSSEDGSIRKWLLDKGEEISIYETGNVITCMGVINNHLAVTGNHKGYIEVRHLLMGDLYSTFLAHADPIDALVVRDNYACSATFDDPSCLKVWEIQFEQTTCIYRIEDLSEIEFCSLAMWDSMAILGASNGQLVHAINFKTNEKRLIDLGRRGGKVEHVRVWNDWMFCCSSHKKDVILDVHRIDSYEHFGTFSCDMHQVCAIAPMESKSSLRIVLGGSALAVMSFHFILMQEEAMTVLKRFTESDTDNAVQKKDRGHYTLKKDAGDEPHKELTDSDDSKSSSEDDESEKCHGKLFLQQQSDISSELSQIKIEGKGIEESYEKMFPQQQSDIYSMINKESGTRSRITEHTDDVRNIVQNRLLKFEQPLKAMKSVAHPRVHFMSKELAFEGISQYPTEPRAAIKRLEKILDENNQPEELEESAKGNEEEKSCKEIIDGIMEKYTEDTSEEDLYKKIKEGDEKITTQSDYAAIEENTNETFGENAPLLKEKHNDLNREKLEELEVVPKDDKKLKCERKKTCFKKNKKTKSDKNKTEKSSHKRCEIM